MGKVLSILFMVLVFSVLLLSGCTIAQEETDRGILGNTKTTTTVGIEGVKTTTKTCPFWNPDC